MNIQFIFSFFLIVFTMQDTFAVKTTKQSQKEKTKAEEAYKKAQAEEATAKAAMARIRKEAEKIAEERFSITASSIAANQAKGIILEFKLWPDKTQRNKIVNLLKGQGLSEEKEIKRFKIWYFKWKENKQVKLAEDLCKKHFVQLSFLKNCSPDFIIIPTELGGVVGEQAPPADENQAQIQSAKNQVEKAKEQVENATQMVSDAEEMVRQADQMVDNARKQVRDANEMVENAVEMVQRAETSLNEAIASNDSDRIASARAWLEDRKNWLEGRRNWLESRNNWLEGRKNWLEGRKTWLESRKTWLESRKTWLQQSEDYLKNLEDRLAPEPPPDTPIIPTTIPDPDAKPTVEVNLKSCNIVSTNQELHQYPSLTYRKGGLTDYWAQEMVGADLLKEDVQGSAPVDKRLVQLFDTGGEHGELVQNLISGEGSQAVLPPLGESIGMSQTQSVIDYFDHSNTLLNKVDEECGLPPESAEAEAETGE